MKNRFQNKKPSTVCQMIIDLSKGQTIAKLAVFKKNEQPFCQMNNQWKTSSRHENEQVLKRHCQLTEEQLYAFPNLPLALSPLPST